MSSSSLKLFAKRTFVSAVGSALRAVSWPIAFTKRVIGFAERHGLDRQNSGAFATGRQVSTIFQPGFDLSDFLFLMRRIESGGQRTRERSAPPICSIIVLAFNKAEFTFQCLRSLLSEVDVSRVEIIVVNNASSDETSEMLSFFGDVLTIVDNRENLGFVGGCNSGAAIATGKHLVFVNNDTIIQPGWLEHLVNTIERDDEVGAVGSLFLYPDGTIQEAGSIVWRDAEALHHGWGESTSDRRFTFAREVDYCSGASLMVRRSLFEQLGGFDERYAPGYYEDTDICFGVRSLGYKVIYQPSSRIIHFEGITAGTDLGQGMKRFQVINRSKFYDKWKDVLEREHFDNKPENILAASNRKREPVVVVFDDRLPTPDRDAGSARMFEILKILVRWSRVIFVPLYGRPDAEYAEWLWGVGVETEHINNYRKLFDGDVYAAIFSRPTVADLLLPRIRRLSPATKLVYDMVDVHFIRLEREHAVTGDLTLIREIESFKKIELGAAKRANVLWCNSDEDRRAMLREMPELNAEVVPTIHALKRSGQTFDERAGILFVGNLKHVPNADGIRYLLEDIFPRIKAELPAARLTIIGDGVTPEILSYGSESVEVKGYVPDIEPYLHSARVFVAPLRFGAGTKGKIGEALAFGIPVVTTSVGAESMGLTSGKDVMIADEPSDFAASVVRLYGDAETWQSIANNGRRRISANFTPEMIEPIINRSIVNLRKT